MAEVSFDRVQGSRFSYDAETQELVEETDTEAGTVRTAHVPHFDGWRGRCYQCDRTTVLLTSQELGYYGYWVCSCGATGIDEVFKCGICGDRWGESASGESDARYCGYCDGTFLWDDCPSCGGQPGGGELKLLPSGRYRCLECGSEHDRKDVEGE